jgi:hypothetical protein
MTQFQYRHAKSHYVDYHSTDCHSVELFAGCRYAQCLGAPFYICERIYLFVIKNSNSAQS